MPQPRLEVERRDRLGVQEAEQRFLEAHSEQTTVGQIFVGQVN
ncbi:MAG: hypothetical protein AAGE59_05000 [Cyanobacteria bacterium P01_F01_bin.86]